MPAALVPYALSTDVSDAEGDVARRHALERARMVEEQIRSRGIRDPRVLAALERVPRHLFIPAALEANAHEDRPLPIGEGQTISQPYIVAYMTEQLALRPDSRVLDVGTGSGYHAAVLASVAGEVTSIEVLHGLAEAARERLARLGYANVRVVEGDGARGVPERAPFDAILVACGAPEIPRPLIEQLAPGGRLIMPVGSRSTGRQELVIVERDPNGTVRRWRTIEVRFVPLTGPSGENDASD